MTIGWWPAIVAGVSGTLAMILAMEALRRAGWTRQNWGSLLGTFLLPPGPEAERWGFLIHFLDGAIAGLVYAIAFALFDLAPRVWVGLLFGVVHGGIGLMLFDLLRRRNPAIRHARMENPGPFDALEGERGRLAIALGFVVYGGVTTGVYGFLMRQASLSVAIGVLSLLTVLAALIVAWITRRARLSPTFTASSPAPRGRRSRGPRGQ
ncbi:MAG TPA: hypothetical protein V6D05_10320 [Stenomitos sp.]